MQLTSKVRQTIRQYQLIKPGDTLLVGVSGGTDSTALIHVLYQMRAELGCKLFVAHVNHQLRKGSAGDQRFVQRLCDSLQLPFCSVKIDLKKFKQKGSLEEIAREKRLTALIQLAKKRGADTIVLGHHQDDLAETVLMRIFRGSGLLGLQGILPKRKIKQFPIIRPLINISREEIALFIKKKGLKFRTDPTNKQTRFFRNKIRLELLPLLEKKYNRKIRTILAHLANNVTVDYDYLQAQGKKSLTRLSKKSPNKNRLLIPLAPFTKLHPSQERMIIRLAINDLKGNMNRLTLTHWQEIEDLIKNRPPRSIVNLPTGVCIQKEKSDLILTARKT